MRSLAATSTARGFGDKDFVIYHRNHFDGVCLSKAMRAFIGEILRFIHKHKINHRGYCVNIKPL